MRMVSWPQENIQSYLGELILIGGDNSRLLVGGGVIFVDHCSAHSDVFSS
jgi:hypothetical protein